MSAPTFKLGDWVEILNRPGAVENQEYREMSEAWWYTVLYADNIGRFRRVSVPQIALQKHKHW